MSKLEEHFDFNSIPYPAFVVVYGGSKHYISSYNRSEYDEHFACGVCKSADDARSLLDGYPGHRADVKVYAVPNPESVHQVLSNGLTDEYRREWAE